MDDREPHADVSPEEGGPPIALPGETWPAWLWLALLVLIAAGLRVAQVANTEVASRDSIGYIRYAWRLEHQPWPDVLRTSEHHPGYPLAVYLVSLPVRQIIPDDLPRAMQLSAQLASCIAGVLLVIPMFLLGREVFNARVGFWAALLYQTLPISGRLLPDGLSEALFLLFAATALFACLRAVRTASVGWCALTGLTTGLAYLTRTEGLLIGLCAGAVLLALQFGKQRRRPWKQALLAGGALAVMLVAVTVPFMLHIGAISAKASYKYLTNPDGWKMAPAARGGAVVSPLPLAVWNFGPDVQPEDRWGWAAYALASMFDKGFSHAMTLPVLAGLWLYRRRAAREPGLYAHALFAVGLLLLLYRLGQSNGYLGDRHVQMLVVAGLPWGVAALGAMAAWLARRRPALSSQLVALALLLAMTAVPLPKTLARLHAGREGFKSAGQWLATHARPEDRIFDPFAWSHYHARRVFQEVERGPLPHSGTTYVVLENTDNEHPHLWYLLWPAKKMASEGELVQSFPARRGRAKHEVRVYRHPPLKAAGGVIASREAGR
jgi:hypothetical protein